MNLLILAGGENRRFNGVNKALLKLGQKTIIEIIINKCKNIFEKIIIVVKNNKQLKEFTNYLNTKIKIVKDLYPQCSSLTGIYSGLIYSESYYNFVLASDMPFVNAELIKYMINIVEENIDVVIPRRNNCLLPNMGYETLHAIYSKNCAIHIENQIKNKIFKIINFFPKINLKEIKEETIKQFDPQLLSFFNINTSKDYKKAKLILSKGGTNL
ncbi:MAG: molybdenum cofactor guanylyltransferase [Endomicrobia bacterium]|nr:molybdenum cofactor guanylyltransferase [Endomicrobiia bacterium]